MKWQKLLMIFLFSFVFLLDGCGENAYPAIPKKQDFIASVNIQAPSISFINERGKVFSTWKLEEGYTGAALINQQQILLYGFQLKNAKIYNLATGKLEYTIDTSIGVTNAIYDKVHKCIYLTNGKMNTVATYTEKGKGIAEQKVGNYPMSMLIDHQQLFVVNYKDTNLSILRTKSLKPLKKWTIEKSSNGMIIVNNQLWLGGHGEGVKPNSTVDIFNLRNGTKIAQLKLPMMPVGFTKSKNRVYAISHGESTLSEITFNGKVQRKLEVGANPFTVELFKHYVVVAGYDDHHVYFLKNGKITNTINVGKGPFQLLVRGADR